MMQPALLPVASLPLEPWFSPSVRQRLAGATISLELGRSLRRALRVPVKIPVSEHAEKYRVVTGIDSTPGRWRPELVPHAKKPMDTYGLPWVEEVWLCAVERAAKTQIALNCMSWAIDCDPGNIFCLNPTELDSGKIVGRKLIPMLQASPRLSRYLSHRQDDTGKTMITLNHGVTIFPAHANSASTMASFFGKHCFGEEVDKYPERTGKEADPITLLRKRGRDKRGSKRLFSSTPAQKFIWKGVQDCHQIWEYELCCPECGQRFIPSQQHIDIPDGATVEAVERGEVEVHLACRQPNCGALLGEAQREAAYRWGRWTATKGAEIARPAKVGFHLPAWGLPAVPLAEIAAAILRAKTGDHSAQIALANGYAATNYTAELSDRKESAILLLRDQRREAELPSEPFAGISCIADMQKRGFWYQISAVGFGIEQESWRLQVGFVDSWEGLRKLMFESEFTDPRGNRHCITMRGMDSGGGESDESDLSRTAESYIFAYNNPGVILFKGQQRLSSPFRVKELDKIPGTNKALPGGLKLYNINVTHFKDRLAAKLLVSPADPGAWHLYRDIRDDYAPQLCAEGKDEHGAWQNPKNRPNHFWDCGHMELALWEIHQVKLWPRPEVAAIQNPPQRRVYSEGVQR